MDISEYQLRTRLWMDQLPEDVMRWSDAEERTLRFVEEALELAQAMGLSRERIGALADYVYSRPVGEVDQEVGGVSVTLAVLTNVLKVSWESAAIEELIRINQPHIMQKVLNRQAEKREAGMTSQ